MTTNESVLQRLTEIIDKNPKYKIEGKLNKNLLAEDARKYEAELLNLLQKDAATRSAFFTETDGGLIFKKDVFLQFLNNKEFLPDSYTVYENEIGLATGQADYLAASGEVVLNWPYKDCVLEGGQDKEDAKREEVFFNEVLAPDQVNRLLDDKVFTNWKRYDKSGVHDLDRLEDNDNLIIRGNNLVVLHSLKKRFAGKIKLIYIDPPFYFSDNKPVDSFKYNSNFKLSTWLTFMRNRLTVARDLLAKDGFIFVHVGVQDSSYINILLDEVFGSDNFVNHVTMTTLESSGFKSAGKNLLSTANNLFIYQKTPEAAISKVYVEKGYDKAYSYVLLNRDEPYQNWRYQSIKQYLADMLGKKSSAVTELEIADFTNNNPDIVFRTAAINGGALAKRRETINKSKQNRGVVMQHPNEDVDGFYILNGEKIIFWQKVYKEIDGKAVPAKALSDVWTDIGWTGIANEGGVRLNNGKKPEKLLKRVLELATKPGDIVLDYHVGSGTTAAVAHKMGRQYIGLEQLWYEDNDPTVRLSNVINGDTTGVSRIVNWNGGGSFVYAHIKNDANTFREKVMQAREGGEMLELLNEAAKSSFLSYRVDPGKLNEKEFKKLNLADQKRILIGLIDNNTLYMNYSDLNDATYKLSQEDKKFNKQFYGDN